MAELFLFPSATGPSPATMPPSTEDLEARQAALDRTQSFIVGAPAGSGKTGLLIQRFLKLLAAENVTSPEQVLAITFTRKATVEMRDRVFAQLHTASTGAEPASSFDRLTRPLAEAALAQDRRLGWNLLEYPRRLNIRTIDSISAEIARSLPILSGGAAGLAPIEESYPLQVEAARRTLMLLGGDDPALSLALETVLLIRDANLDNVEKLIAEMLQWRDQWGELIPIATADLDDAWLEANVLPKLQRALDLVICRGLTQLTKVLPADFLRELCALAAEMGHSEGYDGNSSPIAICAGRYDIPEEKSEHLEHWRALIGLLLTSGGTFRKGLSSNHLEFVILKEHKTKLTALIDRVREDSVLCAALGAARALPLASYPPEQWHVTKALFRVLSRALVELQLVFAEHGQCDFAEMGLLARDALRRDAAVDDLNLAAGLSLQHLLVDEMQDTSTSQYELIELLTRRWDGHSQTVFLVGDPKQSIYLFRQARVERFVQTVLRGTLGDLPLTSLHLTANFRSQENLVEAYNDDFTLLFPADADLEQPELVPYHPAQATRLNSPQPARIWHTALLPYVDDTEERAQRKTDRRVEDARAIRSVIEDWRSRSLPVGRTVDEPWKIAILVRNRIHLQEIVAELKRTPAISFRAVDIEPLGGRQEILDLLALTRALLHPADRTAWLGLLRAAWCGLTLADVHLLAGADDESFRHHTVLELIDLRGSLLSEDGVARLAPFYSVMRAAMAQRGRLRIATWVERTWRSFHAHAFATPEESANIDRYFALLEQLEQPGGRLDLALLAARLTRLYAAPSTQPGAVDLMTIHGSKGLEWDVVFVPALERVAPVTRTRLMAWMEVNGSGDASDDSVAHGILAPIQGKGLVSQQLNTWMRGIHSAREAAERKRLFYVACTRAREELHLFAAPMRKKDGPPSVHPSSLLASAWPAVRERFEVPLASVLEMPKPEDEANILPSLAAVSAYSRQRPRTIKRIPSNTVLTTPLSLPYGSPERQAVALFERPKGSFASRAFGNAVHAFLEQLTLQRAAGRSFESLLQELPSWHPRIAQTLRANGLAPTQLESLSTRVLLALRNTLSSPEGQWILNSHPEATTESALTVSAEINRNIRMDRSFLAGAKPLATGTDHIWIIDYKTATPAGRDLNLFLEDERAKYASQIQTYADALRSDTRSLCLALYYPLIPILICY